MSLITAGLALFWFLSQQNASGQQQSGNSILSNNRDLTFSGGTLNIVINPQHSNGNETAAALGNLTKLNKFNTNTTELATNNPFAKRGEELKNLFTKPAIQPSNNNNNNTNTANTAPTILPSNNNTNSTTSITPQAPPADNTRSQSAAAVNQTSAAVAPATATKQFNLVALYDKQKNCAIDQHTPTTPETYLTHFSCGHVTTFGNGTTLRKFTLIVEEDHKLPITLPPNQIMFPAWTFNGTIPGPTMRMTEGDHVQVTLVNKGKMSHTLHMHSIHPGAMDGVPFASGQSGNVLPGTSFTYDFIAQPFGVYPYHCHADPIQLHINRGLYGVMIIDPKTPRPPAHEFVMLLNGYHLNVTSPVPRMPTQEEANALIGNANTTGNESSSSSIRPSDQSPHSPVSGLFPTAAALAAPDTTVTTAGNNNSTTVDLPNELDNEIYTANGVAFYYFQHPIQLKINQPQRLYLVNMLDFEENSYHMHGNMFKYIVAGTSKADDYLTDMVTLGQGDRGILEFTYHYPGLYMQHAHFDQIASRGWMSLFEVK